MRIDYTEFLKSRAKEHDVVRLQQMKDAVIKALQNEGVHGHISCEYYVDGTIAVRVNGNYYNCFDFNRDCFFNGYVGDR